jgi:hypothetical protein
MKVKMLHDLDDAYGETYFRKGEIVTGVVERTIKTEGDNTTVGHIKKYPYRIGGFYVTRKAFQKVR